MIRQRIRTRSNDFGGFAGRLLVALVAIALLWYGLMLTLLALKVDRGFVNSISGYRDLFDYLAGLDASDFDSGTRAILAGAGALAFIVFGFLALRAIPRPYLARHDLELDPVMGQGLVVEARALERIIELGAREVGSVTSARARAGAARIELDVGLSDSSEIDSRLRDVQSKARIALERHGIPLRPVDVTLTAIKQRKRRELLS